MSTPTTLPRPPRDLDPARVLGQADRELCVALLHAMTPAQVRAARETLAAHAAAPAPDATDAAAETERQARVAALLAHAEETRAALATRFGSAAGLAPTT